MKRFISSVLMAAMLLNTGFVLPAATAAAAGANEIYINFDGYTGGGLNQFSPVTEHRPSVTAATDPENVRGTIAKAAADPVNANGSPHINWDGEDTNNVWGFSVYPTSATNLRINMKEKTASGDGWLSGIFEMKDGWIRFNNSNLEQYSTNRWYDVRLALDWTAHTATLYIDGQKKGTVTINSAFISNYYNNVNFLKAPTQGETYLDDFIDYNNLNAQLTAVAIDSTGGERNINLPVATHTQYLDVDLGGEISAEMADNVSVVLSSADGPVATHTEFIGRAAHLSDYPCTLRVYLDEELAGETEYTLAVTGVKSLIDKTLDSQITFNTESTDPAVYADYVSTLQYGDDKKLPEGTKVNFTASSFNLPEGDSLEVLQNGEVISEINTDERGFSLKLLPGTNEIAVRSKLSGAESEPIMLEGISYSEELLLSKDFDDGNTTGGFAGVNANDGVIEAVENFGGRDGYVMKMQSESGNGPTVFPIFPTMVKGVVSVEYDAYYESFFKMNFCAAIREDTGNLNPVVLTETGMLQTESGDNIRQLSLNTWYKIKVYYDIQKMTFSVFIDDEAIIVDKPLTNKVAGTIDRMNVIVNYMKNSVSTMYMDNFKQYGLARDFEADVTFYNADGSEAEPNSVSYEGLRAEISFSEPMAEADLQSGIILADADGKSVSYTGAYDADTDVYSIETTALVPNSKYSLTISESLRTTAGGVSLDGGQVIELTTSKSGFHIDSYLLSGGDKLEDLTGSEADIIVLYSNDSGQTQSGTVFAGIYKDNMLFSYDTKSINAMPGSGSCTLSMELPSDVSGGAYHTEIYLVESMESLNVIDSVADDIWATSKKKITDGTLVIEAEDMKIDSVMSIIEDSAASGGKAIKVNAADAALTIDSMPAATSFSVEAVAEAAGSYAVWLRVQVLNNGSDSIWYSANSNVYGLLDFTKDTYNNDFYWKNIGYAILQPGTFHLSFKYREKNFVADKMIITNKLGFTPVGKDDVPGENDSTSSSLYPEPAITPIAEHPRLYLTEDIIPALRENMQTPELETAYSLMSGYADEELDATLDYNENGNYDEALEEKIEARALMYVLGEKDAAHAKQTIKFAREYMSTVCYPSEQDITRDIGNAMIMTSVVYDWCYDQLTDDDKEFFVGKLKEFAAMKEIGYPPTKMSSVGSHAGEHEIMRDMISAGIAIYDEDPEMYNLAAGRFFAEYVDSRKLFNKSGNHPQGSAYGSFRFESELFATAIFERMGYPNVLGEEIYDVAYKWLYERLPMGAWFKDGDDPDFGRWSLGGYTRYDELETILSANLSKDPYLRRQYLKTLSLGDYDGKMLWLLLFAEPEAGMEEADTLPLARKTTYPLSSIVARTSWQTGWDAPTAMVQMKVQEKYLGDHMHLDSGAFQIYYKGSLATTSGLYEGKHGGHSSDHHNNYARRTIAHNTVTVYDPDEKVFTPDGVTKYSNDGGQSYSGNSVVMTYDELMAQEDRAITAGSYIGPNEYTPKFSYIKGDLTNSYSDKITSYNRSMVFMDLFDEDYPAAFVVFDKVDSSDASFEKRWHMHSVEEPEIDGNTTVITRTQQSYKTGYNGKLVNKTMLPAEPVIEKVEGFVVDGVEYPVEPYDGAYPEEAEWRIDIKPSEENESDIFLNAMYVTDADANLPELEMTMVENDVMTGVSVKDRLVMFSNNAERIDDIFTITIPDNGFDTVSCLLTDMSAGVWGIESDLDIMYAEATEEEGVIYFEAAPGEYKLVPDSDGTLTVFENPAAEKPEIGDFQIYFYGLFLNQKHPTREIDGVPYVAVDGMFDNAYFEAELDFSDDRRTVTVTKGSKTATITADSETYIYNGTETALANTPVMIDGELYVVLSDFADLLGYSSRYDDVAKILYM